MKNLQKEVEKTAKETGKTEIEIIQVMQSISAKKGDEKSVEILHDLKMQYVKF